MRSKVFPNEAEPCLPEQQSTSSHTPELDVKKNSLTITLDRSNGLRQTDQREATAYGRAKQITFGNFSRSGCRKAMSQSTLVGNRRRLQVGGDGRAESLCGEVGEDQHFDEDLKGFATAKPVKRNEQKRKRDGSGSRGEAGAGDGDRKNQQRAVIPSDMVSQEERTGEGNAEGLQEWKLPNQIEAGRRANGGNGEIPARMPSSNGEATNPAGYEANCLLRDGMQQSEVLGRSEERRVGKEGRSRWSPYH